MAPLVKHVVDRRELIKSTTPLGQIGPGPPGSQIAENSDRGCTACEHHGSAIAQQGVRREPDSRKQHLRPPPPAKFPRIRLPLPNNEREAVPASLPRLPMPVAE